MPSRSFVCVRSLSLLVLLLAACGRTPIVPPVESTTLPPPGAAVSYEKEIKPILDLRCAVCHGCYDAPCQTLLTSYAGIVRGASKEQVYDTSRLEAVPPTRLDIDASTPEQWRQMGFWPVVPAGPASSPQERASSLLHRMIAHGHAHPFPPDTKLPASVSLDIDRPLRCANEKEFDAYAADNPWGGMPYGMAPLSDAEFLQLERWVAQGAPGPKAPADLTPAQLAKVRMWEDFFNGSSNKQRLTARYLYEHLAFAQFYFEGDEPDLYLQLVRSRTPSGEPIDVIATVRPYDDPGSAGFYYRLRPIEGTIVHKTHIVYPLSQARLERWRSLFLDSDWDVDVLPSYAEEVAANPFISFAAIPPHARYSFLLDDARYTVMTFIRGPVCRGQVAVDVIEDRFWVAFLDPDYDLSVTDPTYLPAAASDLRLPAVTAGDYEVGDLWAKYWLLRKRYVAFRESRYRASDPEKRGLPLAAIWDGGGKNDNALLTVMRHFDNAEVEKGFIGSVPKTAWVIDYPILERIYYDLVAGYNVFGDVSHQVSTRLYMDYLRLESEDLFLSFLPPDRREPLRNSWYVGLRARLKLFLTDRNPGWTRGTQITFTSDDPKAELLMLLLQRGGGLWPVADAVNRCAVPPCSTQGASATRVEVEAQLQTIAAVRAPFVRYFPELSLLRVVEEGTGRHLVYTVVHDRAHTNVAFMFGEEGRLLPEDDVLTIIPGYHGSYPNFFFEVPVKSMAQFVNDISGVDDEAAFAQLAGRWGIRRTSPQFWATADWLQDDFAATEPVQAGLLDLNRYVDP